ncbi:MAG: HEAT repeat domain-containing protein [Cyanobacteria bacterium P01_D01_bin.50]
MTQNSIEQIEINLRNEALNIRKAALDSLAEYPWEVAVPILEKLAREKDFALRRLAVMGLGNHTSEASYEQLLQIIQHELDSNVLAEAANSIFEFGDIAVPILQELFENSENWLVRQTVLSLFVETTYYETSLTLAKTALQDNDIQTLKETAILVLGQLLKSALRDQALQILTELADSENWRIRWRVAAALQYTQDLSARKLIAKLQQDRHYRVVAAALEVASSWEEN